MLAVLCGTLASELIAAVKYLTASNIWKKNLLCCSCLESRQSTEIRKVWSAKGGEAAGHTASVIMKEKEENTDAELTHSFPL